MIGTGNRQGRFRAGCDYELVEGKGYWPAVGAHQHLTPAGDDLERFVAGQHLKFAPFGELLERMGAERGEGQRAGKKRGQAAGTVSHRGTTLKHRDLRL